MQAGYRIGGSEGSDDGSTVGIELDGSVDGATSGLFEDVGDDWMSGEDSVVLLGGDALEFFTD